MPSTDANPLGNAPATVPPPSPADEPPAEPTGAMGFFDHLEELRWTLAKCMLAFAVGCVLVIVFLTQVAGALIWPYEFATAGRGNAAMEGLVNTSFLGVFSVVFQLMLMGGLGIAGPFMLYFLGEFIAPGLTQQERRLLLPGCVLAMVLFVLGAVFSYGILLPAGLKASVYMNDLLGFTLLVTASSYYNLLSLSVLGVGLAFEFPLVLLLLIYLGVIRVAQLQAFRRYSIVIFLCVSALVTPTADPVTFLLLSLPLSVLYELAILFGRPIERWRVRQAAELE